MTSPAALKSLTLTAFRGSAKSFTLPFEKSKKLTLIYGENGTGKTTICDAFEFLAFERIGSLENRGMGKGLEKYWPTAGTTTDDLSVVLETAAANCTGIIADKKVSVSPSRARPRIEILRHQQILKLIQAQAADRYEEIKRFIDIEAFERSEETLRQLGKSLLADRKIAKTAEGENLAALQGFYEAAGSPTGLNAVTWAKKKLMQPTTGLDADIAAITKLRMAYEALRPYPVNLTTKQEAVVSAKARIDAADEAQLEAIRAADDGAGDILALLSAGDAYLVAHKDDVVCPLCESNDHAAGLHAAIKSRLERLEALRLATADWRKQCSAYQDAKKVLKQGTDDLAEAVDAFNISQTGHSWNSQVELLSTAPPDDIAALVDWLATNDAAAAKWAATEAGWRDESKFIAQLQAASDRYDANSAKVLELAALIPKVDDALGQCVDERQKFTDRIVSEIAQVVGKLYELVHPGEGLDTIGFELDPNRRASIKLKADFSGFDVPPQAYFSQSHLDTLGLCVFLALAARDRPEETVLILDDVLGSVDEPHVERVIGMIYEVSNNFRHTIVTTHYRPWREKYRWGWLKPGQACQFVELTGWSIDDGIRLISSLPEIDRLKKLLAESPVDPQAICSKAGVILEAVLDYLTQKYECRVPRRQGAAYTLGDLLLAIDNKLRDALKVEVRDGLVDPNAPSLNTIMLKPILDELTRIAQARNAFGAHFKAISFELLDTDAIGFAKQVVQLVDALTHPEHGWPSIDKSGSYWRNNGDSRRLHPLKKPS